MIYFETDSEGNAIAKKVNRREFAYSIELTTDSINTAKLFKYDPDSPDSVHRNVKLTHEDIMMQNRTLLKLFLRAKKLEGCSYNTLDTYNNYLYRFIIDINKSIIEIKPDDIRNYLINYGDTKKVSHNTLDSIRCTLNTFYKYLEEEDYVIKNPMRKIHKIKGETTVKYPFSEEEIELIRDACINMKELALIDFLNTSGVRASELCSLNKSDIDINNRVGTVFGKGSKERTIYFSDAAKVHLQKYLKHRKDLNPALFVTDHSPYNRLSKRGLEFIVSTIGYRAGIESCYPHRFRRTLATRLLFRGMPVEQVQKILGHNKLETTLIYARVSDRDVQINHTKYA